MHNDTEKLRAAEEMYSATEEYKDLCAQISRLMDDRLSLTNRINSLIGQRAEAAERLGEAIARHQEVSK